MKATITKIMKKECTTTDGKKFSVIDIKCDVVINDKGDVRSLTSSMSMDYAKKYFNYCNVTSKQAIGMTVSVVAAKKVFKTKDDEERTYNYIKFLNFLDSEGNPIIMPKDNDENIGF